MNKSVNLTSPTAIVLTGFTFLCLIISGCGGSSGSNTPVVVITDPDPQPELDHSGLTPIETDVIESSEYLAGGDVTTFKTDDGAFEATPSIIDDDFTDASLFVQGDHLFRTAHDDSGPLMNSSTCQSCHINDGRGEIPTDITEAFESTLVKIADSLGNEDPIYGDQIQTFGKQTTDTSFRNANLPVFGGSINGDELFGEAYTYVEYEEVSGSYPDSTTYSLRKPVYKTKDMSFGDFIDDVQFSVRMAPSVFGTGLLNAIPEDNILALVDEHDADSDGISGKASMVTHAITGETILGRFAYKAQTPSVLQQSAGAYRGDIGLTNSLFVEESCTDAQIACQTVAEQEGQMGEDYDVSIRELALVEFYTRVLGVPARRGYNTTTQTWDTDISQGRTLFFEANCTGCHTPRHVTGEAAGSLLGEIPLIGDPDEAAEPIEALSNQTIYPYTDLLLHDMGGSCEVTRETDAGLSCSEGEECMYVQRCEGLADGLIQGMATGTEWKTPALWGIGLVQTVNAKSTFLHDGRARTIEEAILWHGGEAQTSKDNYMQLDSTERAQLLAFLASL
ncbi:MAG: di-heme oxidoredictase family protein [Paraglaciecola sp.]|uniref:di-heme oxidoreductase family protein n=1 Tax=Paraglaciecola sp. TaxID=1920173 RepID=UPI003297ABAE